MAYVTTKSISFPVRSEGKSWIEGFEAEPAATVGTRVFTATRERTGVSLPKWKTRIQNGQDATTAMSATWDTVSSGKVEGEYKYKSALYPTYVYRRKVSGDIGLISGIDTPSNEGPLKSTSFCWNLAAAAYNDRIRKEYQNMQGLVALGEVKETLRMLRRPAQSLRKVSKDWLDFLRKRKKADPKGWTKDLGGAWLEHVFGWKPLINDVNDAVDGYQNLQRRITQPVIRRIAAGKKVVYDTSSLLTSTWRPGSYKIVNNGPYYRCTFGLRWETHIVRFKGALKAQSQMPTWDDAANAFGLSVREFVPTAWELLPWSFLADYFVNIGDCLNSTFTNTSAVLYTNQTLITDVHKRGIWEGDKEKSRPGGAANWYYESGYCPPVEVVLSRRLTTRSAGIGVPMPRLQVNFKLADGQLLNVAALLSQAKALHPQTTERVWHR